MNKHLYVWHNGKPVEAVIRNYSERDFDGLIEAQRLSFPPPYPEELHWNKEQLGEHVSRFPEGALCAEIDGRIAGSMTGLIINVGDYEHNHNWEAVADNGYIRNHRPNGNTLYVVDICIIPEFRKTGLGKWLMQSMYETVVQLRLERLLGGGRMPGYGAKSQEATPQQYVEKVLSGEWNDPVISFLLRCGRVPVGIAENYLDDEESLNYAVIMEWRNPFLS
ncbi:GNAT family N-acetyltransferase [Paenibacillus paeoniae]|uniref:GNAT family N-acetyltransferase n=1 Tax=Paenibacillus paeoniae TaxID=2292705 RepID=A0A371PLN0_9BACL|nr:GNAT family N-acetyltransferase [Paenibacillus paeoniae]REK77114.1 GNAT family N-acetyltransferase [Paenibacillus paeoniae]